MKLHLESVSPELMETLQTLMDMELLAPAALVKVAICGTQIKE